MSAGIVSPSVSLKGSGTAAPGTLTPAMLPQTKLKYRSDQLLDVADMWCVECEVSVVFRSPGEVG